MTIHDHHGMSTASFTLLGNIPFVGFVMTPQIKLRQDAKPTRIDAIHKPAKFAQLECIPSLLEVANVVAIISRHNESIESLLFLNAKAFRYLIDAGGDLTAKGREK